MERAEQRSGARVSDLSGGRRFNHFPPAEPSVPAALEKIASASQRVLSKRIDLLMLDNHEFIQGLLFKAAFLGAGVIAGLAAWFAGTGALVGWLMAGWTKAAQLGAFAAINAIVGGIVLVLALRDPPKFSGETEEEMEDEAEANAAAAASLPPRMAGRDTREGESSGR
jgi:hypothetical protein